MYNDNKYVYHGVTTAHQYFITRPYSLHAINILKTYSLPSCQCG